MKLGFKSSNKEKTYERRYPSRKMETIAGRGKNLVGEAHG
jgi:hypothetical protein